MPKINYWSPRLTVCLGGEWLVPETNGWNQDQSLFAETKTFCPRRHWFVHRNNNKWFVPETKGKSPRPIVGPRDQWFVTKTYTAGFLPKSMVGPQEQYLVAETNGWHGWSLRPMVGPRDKQFGPKTLLVVGPETNVKSPTSKVCPQDQRFGLETNGLLTRTMVYHQGRWLVPETKFLSPRPMVGPQDQYLVPKMDLEPLPLALLRLSCQSRSQLFSHQGLIWSRLRSTKTIDHQQCKTFRREKHWLMRLIVNNAENLGTRTIDCTIDSHRWLRIVYDVCANHLWVWASFMRFAQTSCEFAHCLCGLRKLLGSLRIVYELCAYFFLEFANRLWYLRKPLVSLCIVYEVRANFLCTLASFMRFAQTSCAFGHRLCGCANFMCTWASFMRFAQTSCGLGFAQTSCKFEHRLWGLRKPLVSLRIV